jgi:hypothetical protein
MAHFLQPEEKNRLKLVMENTTQSHLDGNYTDEECSIIVNITWKALERSDKKNSKNLKSPSYDWTGKI